MIELPLAISGAGMLLSILVGIRAPKLWLAGVLVGAAGGVVRQLSLLARRLQHGRVQAYLLYLLIGLAALAVVVLLGADK